MPTSSASIRFALAALVAALLVVVCLPAGAVAATTPRSPAAQRDDDPVTTDDPADTSDYSTDPACDDDPCDATTSCPAAGPSTSSDDDPSSDPSDSSDSSDPSDDGNDDPSDNDDPSEDPSDTGDTGDPADPSDDPSSDDGADDSRAVASLTRTPRSLYDGASAADGTDTTACTTPAPGVTTQSTTATTIAKTLRRGSIDAGWVSLRAAGSVSGVLVNPSAAATRSTRHTHRATVARAHAVIGHGRASASQAARLHLVIHLTAHGKHVLRAAKHPLTLQLRTTIKLRGGHTIAYHTTIVLRPAKS